MKIGIVGAGTIVPDFLEASSSILEFDIKAIVGQESDLDKMNELKNKYHIENIYTNYQEMLDSDVEVVYIAVPNHLHFNFAQLALNTKKHVILEKPFSSNYVESKTLIEIANKNNVIIFEAISNLYLPNYEKTKQLIKDIGNIKIVQLNYSQYSRRYDLFKEGIILPVFDSKKAGGAIMDINVYNIHFVVGLFGKPLKVAYHANIERGIDTSGILTLDYDNFKCVLIGAKDCAAPVSVNIQGDKGFIHSKQPANVYNEFSLKMNDGCEETYSLNNGMNRLYFELKQFAQGIKNNDLEMFKEFNQHTLNVMEILDKARQQVGIEIGEK